MREYKKTQRQPRNQIALLLRLQGLSDPAISDYIAKTRARYGKYSMPIEQVRKLVDESMGEKSLTDILFKMREAEPR